MTQTDVARQLGISQSKVSKLEAGLLVPDALEWFDFCHLTRIPPESIQLGVIDRTFQQSQVIAGDNGRFKLPKKYNRHAASRTRVVRLALSYLLRARGPSELQDYLGESKVDPDFFVDLDHKISLQFTLDLVARLCTLGLLSRQTLPDYVAPFLSGAFHGGLWSGYSSSTDAMEMLCRLIANIDCYEQDYAYRIENRSARGLEISVEPHDHVREMDDRENTLQFLCLYRQELFSTFPTGLWKDAKPLAVTEHECSERGGKRCIYRLQAL